MKHKYLMTLSAVILGAMTSAGLTGCTAEQESEAISTITSAIGDLSANRALAERFVRDVKTNLSPSSDAYEQARESYDDAVKANNHYVDVIEGVGLGASSRAWANADAVTEARTASADFLADASAALEPSGTTRKIKFNRAVTIPDDLPRKFHKLKKKAREEVMGGADRLVRWQPWGSL